jgi:hypothetical protein
MEATADNNTGNKRVKLIKRKEAREQQIREEEGGNS